MTTPEREFVSFFAPQDPQEQMVVESLLDEAGIPFLSKNAAVQDLFGGGRIGGYNVAAGAVDIQVPSDELDRGRELLESAAAIEGLPEGGEDDFDEEEPFDAPHEAEAARLATASVIWSVLWMGGIGSAIAIYAGVRSLRIPAVVGVGVRRKAILGLSLGILGVLLWVTIVWLSPFLR